MADEVREAGADGFDLSAKLDATSITTKTCSACQRAFVVDLPAMKYDDKSAKGRACDSCGAHHRIGTTRLQRCLDCDQAFYCSRECQKAHRPDHRAFCKEQKAKRARTRKG